MNGKREKSEIGSTSGTNSLKSPIPQTPTDCVGCGRWPGNPSNKKPCKICIKESWTMNKELYQCGCEAAGDNIAAFCPIHSLPLVDKSKEKKK